MLKELTIEFLKLQLKFILICQYLKYNLIQVLKYLLKISLSALQKIMFDLQQKLKLAPCLVQETYPFIFITKNCSERQDFIP